MMTPRVAAASWLVTEALLLSLLTSCKVGPDYNRPAPLATGTFPAHFSTGPDTNAVEWKVAEPAAHLPREGWWRTFDDPELNRLEILAATANQQVAAALARFDEARASVNIARADLFPQINLA